VSQDQRHRIGLDPERRENVAQRSSHAAERRWGGRGTGAERPPDSTKGPRRWKAPQDVTSHRLSRVGGHGDLGGLLTRETIAKGSMRARATDGRAKALPYSHGRRRRDRGVRGLVDSRRRGKKTPTLLSPYTGNGARGGQAKTGSACLATIRRSVLECRENTRSPGQAQEPKTLVPSTR